MVDADLVQGSTEWLAVRLGKLGASRIADALARTKSGWGASRVNVRADLIVERLTGQPAERYTNAAMQWGTDTEPDARAAYEFYRGVDVQSVGWVPHPSIAMTGASPDGLVGDNGLVEIKCPNTATHIDTLLTRSVAGRYQMQMMWQMACTGRTWCDFVSFDPRLPAHMQMFVARVHRDDAVVKQLEDDVAAFLNDVQSTMDALHIACAPAQAAE